MDVWAAWAQEVDFTDKKAKVTKKVATGLHLNLAVSHLYRDEFAECAQAIPRRADLLWARMPTWPNATNCSTG